MTITWTQWQRIMNRESMKRQLSNWKRSRTTISHISTTRTQHRWVLWVSTIRHWRMTYLVGLLLCRDHLESNINSSCKRLNSSLNLQISMKERSNRQKWITHSIEYLTITSIWVITREEPQLCSLQLITSTIQIPIKVESLIPWYSESDKKFLKYLIYLKKN